LIPLVASNDTVYVVEQLNVCGYCEEDAATHSGSILLDIRTREIELCAAAHEDSTTTQCGVVAERTLVNDTNTSVSQMDCTTVANFDRAGSIGQNIASRTAEIAVD
jgi:hypothetical protein